jgi:chitinase
VSPPSLTSPPLAQVQFYNQGTNAYTTCDSLLFSSATTYFPGTSVFEMSSNGVELDKIVIGKPINAGAAANGYMDTSTLSSCVKQAQAQGWNAGVMYWEYDNVGAFGLASSVTNEANDRTQTALSVMAAIQV